MFLKIVKSLSDGNCLPKLGKLKLKMEVEEAVIKLLKWVQGRVEKGEI